MGDSPFPKTQRTSPWAWLLLTPLSAYVVSPPPAHSADCVVATVNPFASAAGADAFRSGGNAVDAAVAAAVTLGVVDGHNSGLGGGCFVLVRTAEGELIAIDGRETAPAAAHRDMFLRDGVADPQLSQTGPLASGTPGALAAYAEILRLCGRRSLAAALAPAADLAERGFDVDQVFASRLASVMDDVARFPGTRAVLLKADGAPYQEGDVLRQPDLARTYRQIAAEGTDWFYRGPFAQQVGAWMAEQGGVLSAADFAAYRAVRRAPLSTTYRDWTVIGFPPPSSGGVHVAQMLNMLERYDVRENFRQSEAQGAHLLVEVMKRAFADRAYWLGDADFVAVPKGLLDKAYAADLAATIDPARATTVARHGAPPRATDELFERHTTHIAAADSDGNWVAITATVNTTFGSKVIVPGTGVVLNNEMDDFSAQPGVPNAFGLVGAENNAVAPGKRPLSSMSPTIVLRDGQPVFTVGAAGGPRIISQVLQTMIRYLDLEQSLADAVAAPRVHHQWRPDEVVVEKSAGAALLDDLRARGHNVRAVAEGAGVTQAIARDARGELIGVHDPRVPGHVAHATRP